jgi:predicted MFS family arabinose efflux permease
MLKTTLTLYKNAYGGLPRNSWLLSAIMLVNRSGSMVIPFMGVYLMQKLRFTLQEAGQITTIFGIGSIIGTYLGGWLSDRIGQYYVQVCSLVLGGLGFFALMFMETYSQFAVSIFIISIIAEALRPANSASVAQYSAPENLTRSYSLNRLAANTGYAAGPALGGLLANYDFRYLFLADALTCIAAGILFAMWFKPIKAQKKEEEMKVEIAVVKSPYQDYPFLAAIALTALCVITFFQLFTVIPLYFKEICHFSEQKIGILLGLNGLMVALFEMLIVYQIGDKIPQMRVINFGVIMLILAFITVIISQNVFVLILAIAFFTFGEIFMFPYMNVFTVSRSSPSNRGKFIGIYASVFSIAWTFSPLVGTNIAANFGFSTLWYVMIAVNIVGFVGFRILEKQMT